MDDPPVTNTKRSGPEGRAFARSPLSITRIPALLDRGISAFEAFVLSAGVLMMALNTIANVISRRMGQSLYFAEEVNQFLMVLITFVGISYAVRNGRHIRMSALYDQLSDTWKKVFMVVISLVSAGFMFGLAYYSYEYVSGVAARGRVTPALRIPQYITLFWVPVGFALAGIQYMLAVVKNLVAPGVYLSYREMEGYAEVDGPDQTGI